MFYFIKVKLNMMKLVYKKRFWMVPWNSILLFRNIFPKKRGGGYDS